MPKRHIPATIITTTKRIDTKRGQCSLSKALIIGNITNASNIATVNGNITVDAIFNTAEAMIIQIKTIRKKTARPE